MQSKWTLRLVVALLWAAAAVSVAYWMSLFLGPSHGTGTPTTDSAPVNPAPVQQGDIARLLGGAPATGNAAADLTPTRFSLVGVVTSGVGGAALLTIDGKPAKPYRVGNRIDENTVLQSVGPRHVVLAASMDGPPLQRLELRAPAARASTPAAPEPMAAPGPRPEQAPPAAAPEQRRPGPGAPQRSS